MATVKLALTGKARAGKDALAGYAALIYGCTPFAFGDELKRHYYGIFGTKNGKDREGLQWFGQAMREREPNVWIDALFRNIAYLKPDRVIVTDARQPNEHTRLKAEGYVIIRVNATDETRKQRMLDAGDTFTEADLTHDTESHVDTFECDYELFNNGSLNDTTQQFDYIMRELDVEAKVSE